VTVRHVGPGAAPSVASADYTRPSPFSYQTAAPLKDGEPSRALRCGGLGIGAWLVGTVGSRLAREFWTLWHGAK
jgi:hypothetical protein